MISLPAYFFALFALLFFSGSEQKSDIRSDFKQYYDRYKVEGSFALYDRNKDRYVLYNPAQYTQAFTPASTFKICNSLIGIETGVIPNEHFVIPWDSVQRQIPAWNKDQDLQTAYKNSTVPYYQELARRVGGKRMKEWLDRARYGNMDTSGGIDRFWLSGGLRVTPEQQIDFLRRLHDNTLPFSPRTVEIVKKVMIERDTAGYVLRAKTGWGDEPKRDIGWYVGYVETQDNVYYFCTCIQSTDRDNKDFAQARREITFAILDELGIIKK